MQRSALISGGVGASEGRFDDGNGEQKDVLAAREDVVKPLREANEAEELLFIEAEE